MSSPADFSRPSPKGGCYDVFLSFRGTDTRNGFTNYLYHSLLGEGVYTFMDVELLGEEIDYLFKIIEISKMAVVIFSENFAFSDWCLRELEMILQRKKEKKILVIPIFFKVEVSELKQLTGKTGKYLDQHITKHGETIVKNWKVAVTSFGNVSGLSYKDSQDRSEYEFLKLVIAKINKKLLNCKEIRESFKPNPKHVQTRDSKMMEKGSTSHQNIEISPIPRLRQEHRDSSTLAGQEGYSIATTGYFQKTDELMGKLLNIKPNAVIFIVERGKPSSTCLLLSNQTNNNVAFTVKASQPQKYSVHPNYNGLLPPSSTCQLIFTLLAQSVLPPNMKCSDMFLVESVKIKNDSYPSMDDISRMLTRESAGNTTSIEKHWLNVLYAAPPPDQPVPSVPAPDHLAQLHNKGFVHGAHLVISIDVHQTKPWLLLILELGIVCIWNYKTRTEEKSLKLDNTHRNSAKFIHEKNWIVVGADYGFVRVFDYNTCEKVKEFKAHEGYIICVAVHPTSPFVITTSNDKIIKLWNWKNNWACSETFYEHSDGVMEVAFNPKVSRSFASVSRDGTIKIWSLGSSAPEITIKASVKELRHVEYFVGSDDKLYLLSNDSYDNTVKVWDYESQKLVETLKGHTNNVMATLVHPKLPIIITGSLDKTIRIWNKNTHRLALVWNCDLGAIWSIKYIKASDEVVLGCEDGIIVIKIVNAGTRSD